MDPGNNAARLGLYEGRSILFWVMKNLMGHVLWERLQKEEGDEVHISCQKEHHSKTNQLNAKLDDILASLGIYDPASSGVQMNDVVASPSAAFLDYMHGPFGL